MDYLHNTVEVYSCLLWCIRLIPKSLHLWHIPGQWDTPCFELQKVSPKGWPQQSKHWTLTSTVAATDLRCITVITGLKALLEKSFEACNSWRQIYFIPLISLIHLFPLISLLPVVFCQTMNFRKLLNKLCKFIKQNLTSWLVFFLQYLTISNYSPFLLVMTGPPNP